MNLENLASSRVLAIEDDPVLGAYVHDQLGRYGYQVTWCRNGQEGLALARSEGYDVVLMDILMPGMNGLDVLQRLRESTAVPVILMSALGAENDRISGFRRGADDYLPKPFSMDELQVRVEAILRRVVLERQRRESGPVAVAVDALRFDETFSDVWHNGLQAGLTPSEYRLLETLHRQHEEVSSKAFLYQHVLQRGYFRHDRSLDMHVSQIRRKLKAVGYAERQLRTVWGKGYVLSSRELES
ncbi:response regulator transcription factor [Pseudomonas sp. dw_358]|uniref:response regulator transcription factor n=1 Tax=Pseudomonas sp. dw_358 TaxID=2720083 RepID=UPI001BD66172|nr:response regulator transcription factor [Pseudomonas sp. dw_358]